MKNRLEAIALRVLPPLGLLFLIAHMVLMMIRPEYPLGDPGTPWHFKWGQVLVETQSIPRTDSFSHTFPGKEFINYQWLFQAVTGVTQRMGGIPLTTAVCMILYGLIPVVLFRRMMRDEVNLFLAFGVTGLAWFILTMHSLNRPHVFTYLFFTLLVGVLYRIYQGERGLRACWWVVPMMVLWTNLHGGFSVGLFTIGLVFLVALVRWLTDRGPKTWVPVRVCFLLGFLSGLASLVNPYGIGLHFHILGFLDLACLAQWEEFASPDFFNPTANILGFKFMVLALIGVFFAAGRDQRLLALDLALCLTFLHFALQSTRHVVLFTIVAAPVLARGLDIFLRQKEHWSLIERGYRLAREQRRLKSEVIYFPLVILAYLSFSLMPSPFFQNHFYDLNLSREGAEFIREYPDRFRKPFNTDNMGGALIFYFGPEIPVFMDDRADFYWEEFIRNDYFPVRFALPGWDEVLKKYEVDSLILPAGHSLKALLALCPEWIPVHRDDLVMIYWKADGTEADWPVPKPENQGEETE